MNSSSALLTTLYGAVNFTNVSAAILLSMVATSTVRWTVVLIHLRALP